MSLSIRTFIPNVFTALICAGLLAIALQSAIVKHDFVLLGDLNVFAMAAFMTYTAASQPKRADGRHTLGAILYTACASLMIAATIGAMLVENAGSYPLLATPAGMCFALPLVPWFVLEAW